MNHPTISLVIIDDEPIARAILERYVSMLPSLRLIASCANAVEALNVLKQGPADLLLLDIDMPQLNGISFFRTLPAPPSVIFTTAYAEHAIESYELAAVDYLLKPIAFDRFVKAINKVSAGGEKPPSERNTAPEAASDILFVKSEGRLLRINLAEVEVVEGLKDYVVFHTKSGKLTIHSTMKALEDRLRYLTQFMRIHKSYIVNLQAVSEVDGTMLRAGKHTLPIGATYRDAVSAAIERLRL